MTDLSETFYMTLVSTGAVILGLVIRAMSRSKCDEISFCGVRIHRKVEFEVDDVELKSPESSRNAI